MSMLETDPSYALRFKVPAASVVAPALPPFRMFVAVSPSRPRTVMLGDMRLAPMQPCFSVCGRPRAAPHSSNYRLPFGRRAWGTSVV